MAACNEIKDECAPEPRAVEPWSVCLPWGGRLWSDGLGVYAQGGTPPPDGVYGKVIIANGCLVGVEPEDVPLYTGSPCAADPGDCGGNSGGGGNIEPSVASGNLYALDAAGRPLVKVSIRQGSGVTVSGDGTTSNPYIISAAAINATPVYMRSANAAVAVTGAGTYQNPFVITHKTGLQTTANGLTFDAYGHLIGTTSGSANKGVQGVVGSNGITADVDNTSGIATVSLDNPPNNVMGEYLFGGFKTTLDKTGRLWNIAQDINLGAAYTMQWGTNIVSLNQYGSITDIDETTNPGCCYPLVWPAGGTPTRRFGTITLAYTSALAGVLYTAGDMTFISGLRVSIDGVQCSLGYGGGIPAPTVVDATIKYIALPFVGNGLYVRGQHSVQITAQTAWASNSGASLFLWAAQSGTVGEA